MYHRSGVNGPEFLLNLSWDDLPLLFPGYAEPGRWLPLLRRHLELVGEAAGHTRVTAVEASEAIRRQYAESLEILRIAEGRGRFEMAADIGSGGGYPGLVMAAVRPEMEVHLVEPLRKRARLLEAMAAELGLGNVRVHEARAEEAGRGPLRDTIPLVTARAVAELREVLEYTAPFASNGGLIALPKGSGFAGELESAKAAMDALSVAFEDAEPMRPEISETLVVALFRKRGATAERYPRRSGVPGKRPL